MPKLLSRSKHEEFESNSAFQIIDQKERRAENTKKMEQNKNLAGLQNFRNMQKFRRLRIFATCEILHGCEFSQVAKFASCLPLFMPLQPLFTCFLTL